MQVTVTPKYVNPPKEGKKNWGIKDAGDVFYSVPPDMVPSFKVGQPITFDYQSKDFGGRSINMVERVYSVPTPPSSVAAAVQQAPATVARNGDPRSEDIFVAGVVNNAIAYQAHPLDADALTQLVRNARKAYRNGEPRAKSELDDEIPF